MPALTAPYPVIADAQIELGRYGAAERTLQRMLDTKPNLTSYSRVSYYRELTDSWMRLSGTVYGWVTLDRPGRVWRRGDGSARCQSGAAPVALTGLYCNDPLQPLPTGTNTWLRGPLPAGSACPAGSSSAARRRTSPPSSRGPS